ncbi:transglycosylase SLT domain-containing protein [Pyxidicoccus parkwayensis]|uniref:Transglycosylase SLT domain-containing protein n=1 Tax=Pyxidicoccus parkwayensis TaxID=2813578 RepID=A0ABX7NJ18_9BACT|nr:transglycosylase SLT domain-containing protein [Pyxidicoccus parkwaysis]QSQ18836.1 transglycosylase SLT domain-containing protein [Pyxidicoccus parkwaysis]
MTTISVSRGDRLSAIAAKYNTTVEKLAKANNIADPNQIKVGQKLVIPDGFDKPATKATSTKPGTDNFAATSAKTGPVKDDDGRQFPTSRDGTPMYRQGDPQWGSRALGTGSSISAAGCAMTATSMAVSKITGKVINPGEMDKYLDSHGGYSGNGLNWGVAAKAGGLSASKQAWNLNTINKQIDAGRPVVVGVDYKAGSNGGANGTDHWITITGRGTQNGKPVYYANDPATGKEITLQANGSQLSGGPKGYKTTGELVTFSGGNPNPGGIKPGDNTPGTGGTNPDKPTKPTQGSVKGLPLPGKDLERGAKGEDVKKLQSALVKAGYMTQKEMDTGPGTFGPRTEQALKEFQSANGVKNTGYYGPLTRAAFDKLGAKVGGATTKGTDSTGGTQGTDNTSKPAKGNNDLSGFTSNKYDNIINDMSKKYGVPARLIKAVIQQESAFNPNATSGVGAKGLMQLMPATAKELGVTDRSDPRQSIEGGTKYLAQQLKRYKGDVKLALAAYNAGAGNVDKYGGVPPFKETQNYVRKISGWYNGAGPAA